MAIDRQDLDAAVDRGLITREQADALLAAARAARPAPPSPTSPGHEALAAFGAAVAFPVLGVALVEAQTHLGGGGLAVLAATGAAAAAVAARHLWHLHRFAPAGALAMLAAALAPATLFGLLQGAGAWDAADLPWSAVAPWAGGAFWVSLSAVGAAALALVAFRFPPLAALLVMAAWFTLQATTPFFFGAHPSWAQRALVSVAVGLVVLGAGVTLDGRVRRGFPEWIYLAGLVAFRGGLANLDLEGARAVCTLLTVDVGLGLAALLFRRPVFALAGALGAGFTLGGLGEAAGVQGLAFGAVLGLLAAGGSAAYLRHRAALEEWLARRVPTRLRRVLPGGRGL